MIGSPVKRCPECARQWLQIPVSHFRSRRFTGGCPGEGSGISAPGDPIFRLMNSASEPPSPTMETKLAGVQSLAGNVLETASTSCRSVLVPVAYCACELGISNGDVVELVEGGKIQWAFDVARPGSKARCFRVWIQSVKAYREGRHQSLLGSLPSVIEAVLGTSLPRIRASYLGVRWNLSRQVFFALHHGGRVAGQVEDHTLFLSRADLVNWLSSICTDRATRRPWSRECPRVGPSRPPAMTPRPCPSAGLIRQTPAPNHLS